ncbi:hypothetical protein D3C77_261000 [compost metagenome]
MQQRLTLNMKINVVRMRLHLVQHLLEILNFDKLRFTFGRRAKAAGQIANTGRFNIKLFEFFHLRLIPTCLIICVFIEETAYP